MLSAAYRARYVAGRGSGSSTTDAAAGSLGELRAACRDGLHNEPTLEAPQRKNACKQGVEQGGIDDAPRVARSYVW